MTETTEPLPTPTPEPETPTPEIKPHHSRRLLIILLSILTLTLFALLFFRLNDRAQKAVRPPPPVTIVAPTFLNTPTTKPTTPIPTASITDINWYASPKTISTLNLFKPKPSESADLPPLEPPSYYEVGNLIDGTKIINVFIPIYAPIQRQLLRILQAPNNQITAIVDPKDQAPLEYSSLELLPEVQIATANIPELNPPETISLNGYTLNKIYYTGQLFSEVKNPEKITDTQYGLLYKTLLPINDLNNIKARKLFIKLPDGTINEYTYEVPFLVDDKTPQINWDVTLENNNFFQNFIPGCGSNAHASTPIITTNITSKNPLGKAGDDTVYATNDDAIISDFYNVYKIGREGFNDLLSKEQFNATTNHFIWQDKIGDWQVFLNSDYSPMAECGKPVIYLYPEKTTPVTVQVGAQVRLSDPLYPKEGWQVLAHPNGQLDYQGQTYTSLFWEGLGNGPYPDYRDSGVVIPKSQLLSTLSSQLFQLGLNAVESQDFLDFWLDKFPNKPYLRLTWLGTADMERLAPLTITPKPDTRIRIFLEFEGLDQPITLKPQTLSAPARSGFTLVEWGGLLISSR